MARIAAGSTSVTQPVAGAFTSDDYEDPACAWSCRSTAALQRRGRGGNAERVRADFWGDYRDRMAALGLPERSCNAARCR
jgi:hypothetical protein